MPDVFEKRIRRAEALEKEWPFAAEILGFFKAVTSHQREIHRNLSKIIPPRSPGGYDFYLLTPFLASTLDLLESKGPASLAGQVPALRSWEYVDWLDYFVIAHGGETRSSRKGIRWTIPPAGASRKSFFNRF